MKTFNQFISDVTKMRTVDVKFQQSIFSVKIGPTGNFSLFIS